MKMASFRMPNGKSKSLELCGLGYGCCSDSLVSGEFHYDSVSGFEWLPRQIFSTGTLTQAFVYSVLDRAYGLMSRRKASANADDRAHYELLMETIAYGLKNGSGK